MRGILQRFNRGSERSVRIRKQILLSLIARAVATLASLVTVSLALRYLDGSRFGIWLTISSLTGWFTFMDLGLGNGLRNRFAEAKAKGDPETARRYISTAYLLIALIASGAILLFLLIHPFVDWGWLFNAPEGMGGEVALLMRWVFVLFFLKFAFDPVHKVILADQRPGWNVSMRAGARIAVVLLLFFLLRTDTDSLLLFGSSVQTINTLLPLIAGLILFNTRYKSYRPSFSRVDFSLSRDLLGLGSRFFIMQVAAIVVFATDNMIITRLFGPAEVTPYQIAFRYFTLGLVLFRIITNPYWSAYTDAYQRGELQWIRTATRQLLLVWLGMAALLFLMLLIAGPVYRFWVGEEHGGIPFSLSISMALYVLLTTFTTIFGNFLSGVGKVRLSVLHSIAFIFLNIPLSIFLAKGLDLGPKGVIIGTILSVLPQGILHPLQYRKIMKGTAKGIWDR